jgi:hypothetical protein
MVFRDLLQWTANERRGKHGTDLPPPSTPHAIDRYKPSHRGHRCVPCLDRQLFSCILRPAMDYNCRCHRSRPGDCIRGNEFRYQGDSLRCRGSSYRRSPKVVRNVSLFIPTRALRLDKFDRSSRSRHHSRSRPTAGKEGPDDSQPPPSPFPNRRNVCVE